MERARRLVEDRRDVVILMDSITRLARAYNLVETPSGRTLSGGLDPADPLRAKQLSLAPARNVEEDWRLDDYCDRFSRYEAYMDEMIYENLRNRELGNSFIQTIGERRVYPAIDIVKSSTRKRKSSCFQKMNMVLSFMSIPNDALEYTEKFIESLGNYPSNGAFIQELLSRGKIRQFYSCARRKIHRILRSRARIQVPCPGLFFYSARAMISTAKKLENQCIRRENFPLENLMKIL